MQERENEQIEDVRRGLRRRAGSGRGPPGLDAAIRDRIAVEYVREHEGEEAE